MKPDFIKSFIEIMCSRIYLPSTFIMSSYSNPMKYILDHVYKFLKYLFIFNY
jgi:hypothetical protein